MNKYLILLVLCISGQSLGVGKVLPLLGGSGGVSGPGSGTSTDNAVVRWDGTDASTIQDSGVIVDDSDAMTGLTSLTSPIVLGGSSASDDITINTTSNATKGCYLLSDSFTATALSAGCIIFGGTGSIFDLSVGTGVSNSIISSTGSDITEASTGEISKSGIWGGNNLTITSTGAGNLAYANIFNGDGGTITNTASNRSLQTMVGVMGGNMTNAGGGSSIFGGNIPTFNSTGGYSTILGGTQAVMTGGASYAVILGGNQLTNSGTAAVIMGTSGNVGHTNAVVMGQGGSSSAAKDLCWANNDSGELKNANACAFQLDGPDGDVHIGRHIADATAGSNTSVLYLHANEANEQDNAIGHIAGVITSSSTYVWPVDGAAFSQLQTDASGNLSWQQSSRCEIILMDGSTNQSIVTGDGYTLIDGFATDGLSSNCTNAAASDKITVTETGVYQTTASVSFLSGTTGVTWKIAVFMNGVEIDKCHVARKTSNTDTGSATISCHLDVTTAPWDLDLRVRHDNGGSINFQPAYMNFNVVKIDGT